MRLAKFCLATLLLLTAVGSAVAQGWSDAYEEAVSHAQADEWTEALQAFQTAVSLRPEDMSEPTLLPGPITEPHYWREGSPYSANFGVAYAAYQVAANAEDTSTKDQFLDLSAAKLLELVNKSQFGWETAFLYRQVAVENDDQAAQDWLANYLEQNDFELAWEVDGSFLEGDILQAKQMILNALQESTTGDTAEPVEEADMAEETVAEEAETEDVMEEEATEEVAEDAVEELLEEEAIQEEASEEVLDEGSIQDETEVEEMGEEESVDLEPRDWRTAYAAALSFLAAEEWLLAREAFLEADEDRPGDTSRPTTLPGPITDPELWRGGSPYSPKFGAAYAAFQLALETENEDDQSDWFLAAESGFEGRIQEGELAPETLYFLDRVYTLTSNVQGQRELQQLYVDRLDDIDWAVDSSFLTPEENAAINSLVASQNLPDRRGAPQNTDEGTTGFEEIDAAELGSEGTELRDTTQSLVGVPTLPYKYALIIGNSQSLISELNADSAANDAALIRETLIQHAGYQEDNVDIVVNGTAAEMLAAAQALAQRVEQNAIVTIFYAGAGVNLDGSDYLLGIDTEVTTDITSMVAKKTIYDLFLEKAATVFAFYQVDRPIMAGRYFGQEIPLVGRIAQAHSTIPGGVSLSANTGNGLTGLYANAFAEVLKEYRTNQIPLSEFAWDVFDFMRNSGGGDGGGSAQVPTLPVERYVEENARF
ncbi:MAG: caspase family protein [Fimbriimonadaceae bacterium]